MTTFAQNDFHEHWNLLDFVSACFSLTAFFQNELMDFLNTFECLNTFENLMNLNDMELAF